MKAILLSVICFLISYTAISQRSISGKVLDEKGEPLAGASVFISNTSIGTTTNKQGAFTLNDVPSGTVRLVATFVGYELFTYSIAAASQQDFFTIKLSLKSAGELRDVVIRKYDKNGWKKWGDTFLKAFMGQSKWATGCAILNKGVIKFVYNAAGKKLSAFADEPLILENKLLGYMVKIELTAFVCYTDRDEADLQFYNFFTPMHGTETEEVTWKQNREKAYQLSFMRFMRSLYDNNLKQDGYEVRRMIKFKDVEKQRVSDLYDSIHFMFKDSLKDAGFSNESILLMVEKQLKKDSIKYYRKILAKKEPPGQLLPEQLAFKDVARRTDSGTVVLYFQDYLLVAYKYQKEPKEYFEYRYGLEENKDTYTAVTGRAFDWPKTLLKLNQNEPIEVNENGYFVNTNLLIDGFWGWWEKMATRLPYEYKP